MCSKKSDAIDEHLLLLDIVVGHRRKAGGRVFLVVFKNARLLGGPLPNGYHSA